MKPRVIFFDLAHTLATGVEQSPRRLLSSRLGLTEKETKWVGRLIMTYPSETPDALVAALGRLLPSRDPATLRMIVEEIWEEQVGCVREIDSAASVLESLKGMGLRVALISNTWHPFFEGFQRNCPEIFELLEFSVLSYRLGCKKPSLDLYGEALKMAGEPIASCWMVGDSFELDVEPARETGMHTVWVLSRPELEKTLLAQVLQGERDPPDWTVENLEQVLTFFQKEHDRS